MELNEKYSEYIALIRERLDDYRFHHSMCVAEKAVELANLYGADTEKAYVAGLLHDVCKNLKDEEQLQFFTSSAIMLTDAQRVSPKVWHAMSGAYYVENIIGIDDEEIISAVRYHTTGKADMSLLEKVIYIADFTSSDRTYPDVDVLREIVNKDLDGGIIYALRHTIVSLANKNMVIQPETLEAYNFLIGSK